ncbi:primosomal protein N' [Bifidobacterium oedipodis]|uniref:Probable replication restart protein PriA n=1 Tax=Bifidobacterium oedipodis TaxID=2675322 RepID=A0A7Y0ENU0_9BIFI|nr:primosomal protein N' [Bifidobacterium sp. DSM 109957]NMM93672.1 primosome assembly protein PriA [Bifidobacterium sp. DSM 109957]
MTTSDAVQLALDGLAPRKRRKRAPAEHTPAEHNPIAHVVLDVQALHLGQTFDYFIDEKDSEAARPGVLVRVRFGGQRVTGVIWERGETSDTPRSSIRYIERVLSPDILVPTSMREDIGLIAEAYGGTRANILRFAVPPRVAKVEAEQRLAASFPRVIGGSVPHTSATGTDDGAAISGFAGRGLNPDGSKPTAGKLTVAQSVIDGAAQGFRRIVANYADVTALNDALQTNRFRSFVFDPLPGAQEWAKNMAWMVASALIGGKSAVVALPTMREVDDLLPILRHYGLQPFAPSTSGGWVGDVAVLNADMPAADRYRAYLAVALGQVNVVIGTRAVMYAPVEGPALFAILEDAAYQNMDGFMPYPQARGVLRLRAKAHGGVFVAMANARTPVSQWESGGAGITETPVSGYSTAIHPLASKVKDATPWVRWLNRDELARLADPSIGARVPHTAVRAINQALESGPVLLSIPQDGISETLSCAKCHRQSRCAKCAGPLQLPADRRDSTPRCRWCGAAATNWTCPGCGGERMRVVRVGATGTAAELSGLFRGVPVVISSKTQGLVRDVACKPMIVIATPGFEPRVRPISGDQGAAGCEYRAVAILDAWTSLYALGVDARLDTLTAWMRALALCAPRSRSGQALILGETDPAIAQSLMLWDSRILAAKDLAERVETGMPPAVAAACVWGRRDAVMTLMQRIGALGGDWSVCPLPAADSGVEELPGMLGPVPIAQPDTVDARELEATADRVKAVIRVPQSRRAELAVRLSRQTARHVASREPGELRFRIDPKDLI